jgi:DNA (cytosine-5)-methyltransferase 1
VQAGYCILAAIEKEKGAAETYARNFDVPVHCVDIRLFPPVQLNAELGLAKDHLDILIGCPPCQGFSRMRNGAGADDERNNLVVTYLEFVDFFRPRFGVFENVPGLLNTDHGAHFYQVLYDGLRTLGYGVTQRTVQAADYGVPQLRRRVIVTIGRHGEVPAFPWPTHGAPGSPAVKAGFRLPWRTVRDAIGDYPLPDPPLTAEDSAQIPNHIASHIGDGVLTFITQVPKDGGSRTQVDRNLWLDCHMDHRGHGDVYGRAAWDRPANTVTAGCTNPSKGRFVHPGQDRSFTVREAAALQGFPDDFVFCGRNQAAQVGNAVPPPLAKALAMSFLQRLSD